MIVVRAPLRLPLGGGGTDLPTYYQAHGGSLITAAIDKYIYLAVNRPTLDRLIRVRYSQAEEVETVAEVQHDLVRPALQHLGIEDRIEIASLADVNAGTGLGSSSSYLVALLLGLERIRGTELGKHDLAELACEIEMNVARHPVGKQDQYASAYGGIIGMEIARDGAVAVQPVQLTADTIDRFECSVMLFFTGLSRSASNVLATQAGELQQPDGAATEAMHETRAIGVRIRDALRAGDLDAFGALLHEHWLAKKRRSASVSRTDIDRWYDIARSAGATGGKLVGAGGGGFLMVYAAPDARESVTRAMQDQGLPRMNYRFDWDGARIVGQSQ